MKKLSKVLAVVLALAVCVCPMLSVLTGAATAPSTGSYSMPSPGGSYIQLTVSCDAGISAYTATVLLVGSTFNTTYNTSPYVNGLRVQKASLLGGGSQTDYLPVGEINYTTDKKTAYILIEDNDVEHDFTSVNIYLRVNSGYTGAYLTNLQGADLGGSGDAQLIQFPNVNFTTGAVTDNENAHCGSGHDHAFTSTSSTAYIRTTATCQAKATYWKTCATCGMSAEGNDNNAYFESGSYAAHKYTSYTRTAEPTCTVGHKETAYCDYGCGTADVVTYTDALGHSYTEKLADPAYIKTPATCTTNAVYYYKCVRCTEKGSGTWTQDNSATGHNLTPHAAVPPTCGQNGDKAYWSCSNCNKYFDNAEGTVEVSLNSWKGTGEPATGNHNYVYDPNGGKNSTEHTEKCSVCGSTRLVAHTGGSATCTEEAKCTVCGTSYGGALGHAYVDDYVIAQPTKTSKGSMHQKCSRCDAERNIELAIPTLIEDIDCLTADLFFCGGSTGSSIGIKVSANNVAALSSAGYSSYILYGYYRVYSTQYDTSYVNVLLDETFENGLNVNYTFTKIPIFALTDNVTFTFYLIKDKAVVAYYDYTTSVMDVANRYAENNSGNTDLLIALNDMAVYGDAARDYFKEVYSTATNVDKHEILTDVSSAVDAFTGGASPTGGGLPEYTAVNTFVSHSERTGITMKPVAVLGATNQIRYIIKIPKSYTLSKVTINVAYIDGYGVTRQITVTGDKLTAIASSSSTNNYFELYFDKVAIYDIDKTVKATATYKPSGTATDTYTVYYNLASFVNDYYGIVQTKDVVLQMAQFAESLRTCLFASKAYNTTNIA